MLLEGRDTLSGAGGGVVAVSDGAELGGKGCGWVASVSGGGWDCTGAAVVDYEHGMECD